MKRKKLSYCVFIVIFLVLGYLNYFSKEKMIDEKEAIIETVDPKYDNNEYKIEAKKQYDYVEKKETLFELATAKLKNMVLSGNEVVLDPNRNLFLRNNVLGKSINGWEIKTEQLNYIKKEDKVNSDVGLVARNEEQDITISGKRFEGDSTLTNLKLVGDVAIKSKGVEFLTQKARYNDKEKLLFLDGEIKLNKNEPNENISGVFRKLKYNLKNFELETDKTFSLTYNDLKISGEWFKFNTKTEAFEMSEGPVIRVDDYDIRIKRVYSTGGKIELEGDILGTNGIYNFIGKRGYYDKESRVLTVEGDVTITDNEGGKLIADKIEYSLSDKKIELTAKNDVKYSDKLEREIVTKKIIYLAEEKSVFFKDRYSYKDKNYSSTGKEFYYNRKAEKGYILEGDIRQIETGQSVAGNRIDFDKRESEATILGKGHFENKDYILKSEKMIYTGSKDNIKLPVSFEAKRKGKDDEVLRGEEAYYNLKDSRLEINKNIKYILKNMEISTESLSYDEKSGVGESKKKIIIHDKEKDFDLVTENVQFKKESYIKGDSPFSFKSKEMEMNGKGFYYNLKTGEITSSNSIEIRNRTDVGNVNNGKYNTKTQIFTGERFIGDSVSGSLKSDIIIYNLKKREIILEKDVTIKREDIVVKGKQICYDENKETIRSEKPFDIESSDFKISSKSGQIDLRSKIISSEDVVIKDSSDNEIKSEAMRGNYQRMQFEFIGKVIGKLYSKGERVDISSSKVKINLKNISENRYEVEEIEAFENSEIKRKIGNIRANYLHTKLNKKFITAKDKVIALLKDKNGVETELKAENLDLDVENEVATARENVEIKRPSKKGILLSKSQTAQLNNKERMIKLTGSVELNDGETKVKAGKIDYNIITNKIKARENISVEYIGKSKEKK